MTDHTYDPWRLLGAAICITSSAIMLAGIWVGIMMLAALAL